MRFGESACFLGYLVRNTLDGQDGAKADLPGTNFALSHLPFTAYISVFAYRVCGSSSYWVLRVQQAE